MRPDRTLSGIAWITLLFLAARPAPCPGACRLTATNTAAGAGWRLENDVLAVTLLPGQQGSIEDLRLKNKNLMTLAPYRETREEVWPGTGVFTEGGAPTFGCRDAIWPAGLDTFSAPHEWALEEPDAGRVRVRMSLDTPSLAIEREVALADGESALDITVRLTNRGSQPLVKSYWFQCFVRIADTLLSMPGDDSELLLLPARAEIKPLQSQNMTVTNRVLAWRTPEDGKNCWVAPAQPWLAAIDRTEKLILAAWFDVPDFPRDMAFYSWPGDRRVYSMEAIWPTTHYETGVPTSFHTRLMVVAGLPDVHLVRPGYVLCLVDKPAKAVAGGQDAVFRLAVVSPVMGSGQSLRVVLASDTGQAASPSVSLSNLSPDKPVYGEAAVSTRDLAPGAYPAWIEEADGSRHELIGQQVVIQQAE